jgi:hypothetical protein
MVSEIIDLPRTENCSIVKVVTQHNVLNLLKLNSFPGETLRTNKVHLKNTSNSK